MMSNPRILAYAAGDLQGVPLVVAAGRAGALGVLDLSRIEDLDESLPALRQVARGSDLPFAARVRVVSMTPGWLGELPGQLSTLILIGEDASLDAAVIAAIHRSGRSAWAEVTDRLAATVAEAAGASGLVATGHEAGGLVGDDSSFILAQAILASAKVPVWVRGGVGPRVAAGCVAMGAAGVVVDGGLLLAEESSLSRPSREMVRRWDGGETRVFGPMAGPRHRLHLAPGSPALGRLKDASTRGGQAWASAIRDEVGWEADRAWPVGQDAAIAGQVARSGSSARGILDVYRGAIDRAVRDPLAGVLSEGSPMARSIGTRYPIFQGPMTRVSDVAGFADAVARGGALPFLALAMLPGRRVATLLESARQQVGERRWGVGLLGFVDPDLRREQVAAVIEARPPFALIAGGRPDQARELEAASISTFLHVPSPGLLHQFIREGARKFVLEGRECGGHVGPRSSFVLWEQAIDAVSRAIEGGIAATEFQVVFAGGIHDRRSARFVSAMAGPMAALGVNVGVLVGTAYLFTREAVSTGAIVDRYQAEAIRCGQTVLLETGPGHEVRVGPSPFVERFAAERSRLEAAGKAPEEVREALEALNVGRLRVATKGFDRPDGSDSAELVEVHHDDQFDRGMYMLGQVATLRDRATTIDELHRSIAGPVVEAAPAARKAPAPRPADIAVVGMSAILPGAGDVRTFWENTLRKHDAVTEIPGDRWDWRAYYDPDPKAPDKIVSKWGGFVPDVPFDPLRYGMPPSSLPSIEPVQLLLLEATRAAIADAGYADRPFARERTAVVLGMGGGAAQLAMGYAFRSYLPMLDAVEEGSGRRIVDACKGLLPEWTEDSFPGFLLNVAAGRVSNRFDLGGANYTVDAACGSSLAAASLAVRELESGAADVVLLGGADTVQNPFTYLAFSKTHAFSPRGRCRPFDASADGIVISEGVAMVVLKRLEDAKRDGDRIYSVIKGLGSSSDGKARGLTAPSPEGQVRAVVRAYDRAGIDPSTIGYVEAHGTGTAVGDVVEVNAISGVFRDRGAAPGSVAIGSVKSMIGHTKCAAGLAGLINASLALHHRVVPPTLNVDRINPKADLSTPDAPFRVNTETRPWLGVAPGQPRRAGVSAFGFGGTNFHAVLEAFEEDREPTRREWPAELFAWRETDPSVLAKKLDRMAGQLRLGARPDLRDLAHAVNQANPPRRGPTLSVVATSVDDLLAKLDVTLEAIRAGMPQVDDPRGVFYHESPPFAGEPVAFLFPGQGSQRPGMLGELAITFDEVFEAFEAFESTLAGDARPSLGARVFPPMAVDDADRDRQKRELAATDVTQPALGASSVGLLRLLGSLGIEADLLGGHSFGELVALHAAGSIASADLATLARERGRLMREALGDTPGAMAAIAAPLDAVRSIAQGSSGAEVVNENGPNQTVVAGPPEAVARVVEAAGRLGLSARTLPVAGAFHSSIVKSVQRPLEAAARKALVASPDRPVYSNVDALPHPADPAMIASRVGQQAASPVRFAPMVEAMYDRGARVFVEVGPGSVLASLVGSILKGRPHLAVACDSASRGGLPHFLATIGRLVASGIDARLGRLSTGRVGRVLDLDHLPAGDGSPPPSPSTWMVNGSRSRPIHQPEPPRLGQSVEFLGRAPAPPRPPAADSRPGDLDSSIIPTNGTINHATSAREGRIVVPLPVGSSHGKAMNQPPQAKPGQPERNGHPAPSAANGHAAHPIPAGMTTADERVLASFQETMRVFLDVQRTTMSAYLAGRSGQPSAGSIEAPTPPPQRIATPPTPAPQPIRPRMPVAPLMPAPVAARANLPASPAPPIIPREIPAASRADAAEPVGRDAVARRLLEIVRDRTGYPAEMLGFDLDLEADLGIDSIKRVEILGSLRDSIATLSASTDSATMDALSRAKTLGAIVDRVDEIDRRQKKKSAATSSSQAGFSAVAESSRHARNGHGSTAVKAHEARGERSDDPDPARSGPLDVLDARGVKRLSIRIVDAPPPARRSGLMPGGVAILTGDGRGSARALAARFEAAGHPVFFADRDGRDLDSLASVAEMLDRARALGPIAAIVHVAPLRSWDEADLDVGRWSDRLGREVRGLFLLAKSAATDLETAARNGGGALIAATGMGGAFGSALDDPGAFFPGQGGISGLMKTLAREWPIVRTRVVDLAAQVDPSIAADRLFDECRADDGWSEVGYLRDRRIRLEASPTGLDRAKVGNSPCRPGEPVVITGGARGITAAVALELAGRWKPTLLLVGRSPLPEGSEDPETASIDDPALLKAALLDRLRRSGRPVRAADLEAAYRSILQAREIRSNLAAIRAAGSVVEYAQADVRDVSSIDRALNDWRGRFGPFVGLIHGAGVIQDKLIRDKSPESFDAVLGTKLDGALNLARSTAGDPLRFTVLFSSIAGRFGNAGQSDYAAANDVLNKLAVWLDRRRPGRVVSVNWGPWSGVGMVSDLEGHLGGRGLGMIPPEVGRRMLADELEFGAKGDVEVIVAGELGTLDAPMEVVRPTPERVGMDR